MPKPIEKEQTIMLLILTPRVGNNFHSPNKTRPQAERELVALAGTAIDPETHPILAAHWPGPLIVGGVICCNDNSPLTRRFDTAPVSVSAQSPETVPF
jgi:hypothetical protein